MLAGLSTPKAYFLLLMIDFYIGDEGIDRPGYATKVIQQFFKCFACILVYQISHVSTYQTIG